MDKENLDYMTLEKIRNSIDELRDLLNEICENFDESQQDNERLRISRSLDELIVNYMKKMVEINSSIKESC